MKKLFFVAFLFVCSIQSNGQDRKYVTLQVEIANRNGDFIYLNNNNKTLKKIQINKEGIFKDTLNVKEGFYEMFDGVEYASLYLKNGFDLQLKMDAKEFDESLVYSGKGSAENNYLAQNALLEEKFNYDNLLAASVADFNKQVGKKKQADFAILKAAKLDPNFVSLQKRNIEMSLKSLEQFYNESQATNKLNNSASASFNYENHKGGKTKLEDFKGKYVYIDVWATWCGPCRAEIPFLKKVEEKYHGKNIEFVSISIDVLKDHDKWKKFVTDKELEGVQLLADKDWNSDFVQSFGIHGIPRFILIDPNGKVVKADATRPSSPKLQEELDALLN